MIKKNNGPIYYWGISLSFVMAIAAVFFVAATYMPRAIVAWDEASNMVWGYKIYQAIQSHQWGTAYRISYAQVYYPPLQSWYIGITSLVTGFSVSSVRVANLLWLLITAPLIFHIGYSTKKTNKGAVVGLLACIFFLFSPMTLAFSGIALKELMGTALTLISYVYYRRIEEKFHLNDVFLGGVVLLAVFYFKYNYALPLYIAYTILTVVNMRSKIHKNDKYRLLIIFLLFVAVGMGCWILVQNIRLFTEYIQAQTPQTAHAGNVFEKIAFYPQSIVFVYAPNFIFGIWMIAALCVYPLWLRQRDTRALWFVSITYIILLGLYAENLHERYIFPALPFVYVLTSSLVVAVGDWLRKQKKIFLFICMWLSMCVGVFLYVVKLPGIVFSVGAHTLRSPIFNQPDYRDTIYDFSSSHWPKRLPESGSHAPSDVILYVLDAVGASQFAVVGNINELSPKYWELSVLLARGAAGSEQIKSVKPEYIVTVELTPDSRFYTRDYLMFNAHIAERIPKIASDTSYARIDRKAFSDLGIIVTIYRVSKDEMSPSR